MKEPIAVLMSVYKKDDVNHLQKAIESILNQTYKDIRLYIGVDGKIGTDLELLLQDFEEKDKIEIFWFPVNRGLTPVLNDLLSEVKKKRFTLIARMDADDISKPDRFQKQVEFLNSNPDIDVCGGAIEEIEYSGETNGKIIHYPLTHQECFEFFAFRNPFAHPAVMFRDRFFDKVNGYNSDYKKNQDTELWFRALKEGCQFGNIKDVILSFRISQDMYKRRGGVKFAGEVLKLRKKINKELHYGFKASLFGYAYYLMAISPGFVKKLAYKTFR